MLNLQDRLVGVRRWEAGGPWFSYLSKESLAVAELTVPHVYLAVVPRVIDGDTIVVDEYHGKVLWLHDQDYRVHGGNAYDRGHPGYAAAKANLAVLRGETVLIHSYKPGKDVEPDKYGGRWLGRVKTRAGDLTDLLVVGGWMAPWNGAGPKPVPVWPRPAGLPSLAAQLAAV